MVKKTFKEEISKGSQFGRYNENWNKADVICGGFPCQDVSNAGKRAGIAGSRSGLWGYMVGAFRLVRPKYGIVENVAGLLSNGMDTVLGDLAASGYDAEWDCISAASVGAPHQRDRVWIIANDRSERRQRVFPKKIQRESRFSWCENVRRIEDLPDRSDLYESKLCRGGNGVRKRLDAIGNAVVPQIVEILGRAIMDIERKV